MFKMEWIDSKCFWYMTKSPTCGSFWRNFVSWQYGNKPGNKKAQFAPMGIPNRLLENLITKDWILSMINFFQYHFKLYESETRVALKKVIFCIIDHQYKNTCYSFFHFNWKSNCLCQKVWSFFLRNGCIKCWQSHIFMLK
jgi:hypothetical protein